MLHVLLELWLAVAVTCIHSLHTASVGVIGHVQLSVGQLAKGSVALPWSIELVTMD